MNILDPKFRYVDSYSTDLRKTFARIRRENASARAPSRGRPRRRRASSRSTARARASADAGRGGSAPYPARERAPRLATRASRRRPSLIEEDRWLATERRRRTRSTRSMKERKQGTLRSGGSGKKVTSRKQAIAIGLSEARKAGGKVPPRRSARRSQREGGRRASTVAQDDRRARPHRAQDALEAQVLTSTGGARPRPDVRRVGPKFALL
jgi:hypothetical protein